MVTICPERLRHLPAHCFHPAASTNTSGEEKDARLARSTGADVEWHFLPNRNGGGSLGAHPEIIDALERNGIRYVVYPPGT